MMPDICWRASSVLMCGLLALQPAFGIQAGAQAGLRIVVVEGGDARNVVQQIPAQPLIVRIEDASNRPVDGATVVFTAPQAGPSGEFENGSNTLSVITGPDGLAVARDYHPNVLTGSYQIQVRAEFQGQTATTAIAQRNIAAARRGRGKLIAILAIAGAAVGAVIAARSGGDDGPGETATPPTITFGGGAVGAPAP
jgi:hypothetical protein